MDLTYLNTGRTWILHHPFLLTIMLLCMGNRILINKIWNSNDSMFIKPDTENKTIYSVNWWMVQSPNFFIFFSIGSLQPLDLSWHNVSTTKITWSFNCNSNSGLVNRFSKKTLCFLGNCWQNAEQRSHFLQIHIEMECFLGCL